MKISDELNLLLRLMGPVYREPAMPPVGEVEWESFIRLADRNKVLYYAVTRLLDNASAELDTAARTRLEGIRKHEEGQFLKLRKTMEALKTVLKDEPFLVSKTHRVFPYATHDADVIVRNLKVAGELFVKGGFTRVPMANPVPLWYPREKGLLEIEVYTQIMPNPMVFVDDAFPWGGSRETEIEGVKVMLPGIEAEILTFLAEMGFRLFEILLGDMVHLFTLADKADWQRIEFQVRKYGWHRVFRYQLSVLNGFHREIYGVPGPLEAIVPAVSRRKMIFPSATPCPQAAAALAGKGASNLIKMPAYLSVRLKKYPRLHRLYVDMFMKTLTPFVMKYLYH
ncbi:MAG: hypothetical protein HYX83_01455 [Chloroflexi bacterium]|nr:hypothetical protein [Chloroflexota bacterium]